MARETIFCKHYRAMSEHDTCSAGVAYSSFDGLKFDERPCFMRGRDRKVCGGCDKAEFPTKEEIEAEEREIMERYARTLVVRAAIVEHLGGPWKRGTKGSAGSISCPVCDGGCVNFTRSGYNGHVHAKCSTEGCVSWME